LILKGIFSMKPSFGQDISLMRFFGSSKQTYANKFVVDSYFGQPFAVFFSYAKKTASILNFCPPNILRIFQVRNFAQIGQFIIGAVAVNVIYLIRRPSIINVEPHQTMGKIKNIIKPNTNVTMFHLTPDNVTQTALASHFSPCKKAGFRVVIQKFVQSFWRHGVNINSAVCGGQV